MNERNEHGRMEKIWRMKRGAKDEDEKSKKDEDGEKGRGARNMGR